MGPLLAQLERLPNLAAACRTMEISPQTVRYHLTNNAAFNEAYVVALDIGLDLMEQELHRRAMVGVDVVTTRTRRLRDSEGKLLQEEVTETQVTEVSNALLVRFLEAHRPRRWSRKSEVHQTGDVAPVVVVVERTPTRERMLELARLAQELEPGPAPPDVDGTAHEPSTNGDTPE